MVAFVECTYVDTSGITALVSAHRKFGKRLHVIVPHDSKIRKIFEVTGLHRTLLVHDDFRAAIEATQLEKTEYLSGPPRFEGV